MPEMLKELLDSLSDADKALVWEYLDSNPKALDEMIEVVAE